ncbi:MAG TPA: pitrilysin family protein [Bryobacteraceae bacterium]|nr:pitrilysin family protein [Bryobacteraceae bacterium]
MLRTIAFGLLATLLPAQNLKEFEKKVTEFTLSNGLHFIVLERHEAPVVSFDAFVNVGAVDDPAGQSSMAHMFEHMIGKGIPSLGSKNWPEEQKLLAEVEKVYDRAEEERRKGPRADPAKLKQLEAELKEAIEKANADVDPNAYVRVINENGGAGFNAGTAQDYTTYFYGLPSNRIELWFLLQSEWFRRPVFREFYKERDIVREERRMRVESSVQGKLQELLLATAFMAHPYRNLIGWASEIERLRAKQAEEFFRTYYVPGNVTISLVGDVNPAQIKRLAEKYYGSIPAGPLPPPVSITEPEQEGPKRAALESDSQPLVMIAYKRPSQTHADDPVFDVIAGILSSGRTGLLYKDLVRDQKIALGTFAGASFPSGKYPHLFVLFSVPSPGHTVEENEKSIYAILDGLRKNKVDAATLERVKTKIRAGLLRQLDSNSGLASQLAFYQVEYGNWRTMFTGLEDINKVTADDVQRVARKYFNEAGKTVAFTTKPETEAAAAKADAK